ncbi:ABC-2 type transport system ATP-binding protein [Clostridium punense]|uniref:ABC-2 type transport system ATP-binding protein n=1 Tax=Clostridium punense TaxID=1054297 RepID=A0ABS4K9M7_9CLOT|nr:MULTISPECIES: ABC transporter ATP-binding protein [Clostridium]EQB90400.1 hypothetical protein M918_00110 [Clostridium sp. BL8]MBP2023329.1 ABC-2 type transport system ATP-binding protein [Clostridium punense]
MGNDILKLIGISKKYKNLKVLDSVSMTIKKGEIYGLIGLNGAGKSTLLRIITGLSIADKGTIQLFGESEQDKLQYERRRVGAVVEAPALYDNKTVYENMHINRLQKGIPGELAIEKLLRSLELIGEKNKKVKTLSLGGKQRLAIAMALLGDPELIILDEPINGLDPVKVIELRELLKKLNREYGITILISSHILGEVYHLATRFGVIHKGKIVEELPLEELNSKCKKYVHIKVDNAASAAVVINKELGTLNYNILPNEVINLYDYVDETELVTEVLVKAGIKVKEIMPKGEELEAYFSKIVGGEQSV